jgi:hypothetical protein
MEQPTRKTQLLEPGSQPHVVPDVVGDVPATHKSTLSDVNDIISRPLHARRDDGHEKLSITVEEGYRAVGCQAVLVRLIRLRDEADNPLEEASEGALLILSCKSSIGDSKQGW